MESKTIPALKVRQWMESWDEIHWGTDDRGTEPLGWFYQFSMVARDLKALCGIYPRTTSRSRGSEDYGIQRQHQPSRSEEIREFVQYGYPWSDLRDKQRRSGEFDNLKQPGWLPTAIVVNILTNGDARRGQGIRADDIIVVNDDSSKRSDIMLPESYSGPEWKSSSIPPMEVIDGQHRLWAFDSELNGDFELPVVAFHGLDIKWQAYLFYTINVKPKKINASLAFDLYPLLRTQEWLTKFEGHAVYRETRAQEIVDLLWSVSDSPWYKRINMLGEQGTKGKMVTQASWIRSLLASFVKRWEGNTVKIGGLFGSAVGTDENVLPWKRTEQAAFLIFAGIMLRDAIKTSDADWIDTLRRESGDSQVLEGPIFGGQKSLLNQDQGLRVFLQVVNDLFYVNADNLKLLSLGQTSEGGDEMDDQQAVTEQLELLMKQDAICGFMNELAGVLSSFDWRSSDAPGLSESERIHKSAFRGSSGYKELRRSVLKHVAEGNGELGKLANAITEQLGY